ncbi:putative pentatricopeptide repeat-containing protein [Acorus gramineus]|uniref:Pentatricopeptide repeat-containing protein n=1 Tax=Acorus gramineus TaxID=55184 RepID=A0AAV9BXY7_ACOGR|nr:putative pentatricopeptide repeat-containing protein [Acorus gramineus]
MVILPKCPRLKRIFTSSCVDFRPPLQRTKDSPPTDAFESNARLKNLVKSCRLIDARSLFDGLSQRDEVTWTTIISGYINASDASEALLLFSRMRADPTVRADPFVLSAALKACALSYAYAKQGQSIHGYASKTGFARSVFVGSSLLDMYAKTGLVSASLRVFEEMPERNVVSWTALITGLVRSGRHRDAIMCFSKMWVSDVQCDSYTFASALKACADAGLLNYGREIHLQAIKSGLHSASFVASTLLTMYNKCGKPLWGIHIFETMNAHDVVSWTSIISGYVQMGSEVKALESFHRMRESGVRPNEFTFAAVVSACTGLAMIDEGLQLHAHVIGYGLGGSLSVSNAIVTMYSRMGHLDMALRVFQEMKVQDLVSWSAIITGYAQEGSIKEAFDLFSWMRREGTRPNEFTLSVLLSVCAYMAMLEQGKQVHAYVLSVGLEHELMIGSALINMYSKCGCIEEASNIFHMMNVEDTVSWTTMINGYAEHGYNKEAIDLFEKMLTVGLKPDHVTFIGVLNACSHVGLVDLGFHYFNSMRPKYQVNRGREHYGCMVDLLCRAGRLDEAESMILSMPFRADEVVWSTLLRACRIHGDAECGSRTAKRILECEPDCATTHITLSNIYAALAMWSDVADVRKLMRSRGVKKEPGWSWIEIRDTVSVFVVGDQSHPWRDSIYEILDSLTAKADVVDDISELDAITV